MLEQRQAAAAAADRNRVQAARSTVKQLKQRKRLEAAIEEDKNNEQSTRSDMAAEVEELNEKFLPHKQKLQKLRKRMTRKRRKLHTKKWINY